MTNTSKILLSIFLFSFLYILTTQTSFSKTKSNLITVPIGFLDSLAQLDSIGTNGYKESFEAAIFYGIGENEKELNQCGYRLLPIRRYFSISDLLEAKEMAEKLEAQGVWIILGPEYSDPFLLAMKGLHNTPIVSTMAGTISPSSSSDLYFKMSPNEKDIIKAAINAAKNEHFGVKYAAFIDATCSNCIEFENKFHAQSENHFERIFTLDFVGDSPDLTYLIKSLKEQPVDFLLLPNYSKQTGYIISNLHTHFPELKYLGSNGWGAEAWSYIQSYHIPKDVTAINIRVGLSINEMKNFFNTASLEKGWDDTILPPTTNDYLTIGFIRKLTKDLCEWKPKNKDDYTRILKKQQKTHFLTNLPISVYRIKNGVNKFDYVSNPLLNE